MTGRTVWWSKDSAWWRRSRVVELGQAHGPAGPAVLDWLTCEAKNQGPVRGHDGSVKAGYAAIAHGCFIASSGDVKAIVATCVELELLDDFDERGRTFTCRISGWHEDIEKPYNAYQRAQQRADDNGRHEATTGDNPPQRRPDVALQDKNKNNNTPQPPEGEPGAGAQVIKFDRRPVPADRLELAEHLLNDFNATAKTGHRAYTGRGRPSESLTRIIGALTDWADVTAEEWAEVIRVGLKRTPFWDGRPTPGVVFGPAVVQRNIDEVRRRRPAAAGGKRLSGIDFLNDRSSDD